MATFFRKGDRVRLLTLEELKDKCVEVKEDFCGIWVREHFGSPKFHAYLDDEYYYLGCTGVVKQSGYKYFLKVELDGLDKSLDVPAFAMELAKEEPIPDLAEDAIDDVVNLLVDDSVDVIDHVSKLLKEIDGVRYDDYFPKHNDFFKLDVDSVEPMPNISGVVLSHKESDKTKAKEERVHKLADLYSKAVKLDLQLSELIGDIDDLLEEESKDLD